MTIDDKDFIKLQANPIEEHMSFLRRILEEKGMAVYVTNEEGDPIGMVAIENGQPIMKPNDGNCQMGPT